MLADSSDIVPQSGRLDPDIHLPCTVKLEIIGFIAEELPRWRDHADRPSADAETTLTEYLCDHLNSAVHHSSIWSHIQFRTETGDETHGGRKIDLTVKPRAATFIIEGRRSSRFNALFPIECKRLPTPKGRDRDEREYVTNKYNTTGGIQRFKFGYQGAAHTFAAMIAYIQEQSCSHWVDQVNGWIKDLATETNSVWSDSDALHLLDDNLSTKVSILKSEHQREGGLNGCELRHLWISMC